jgi:hypothetical protein
MARQTVHSPLVALLTGLAGVLAWAVPALLDDLRDRPFRIVEAWDTTLYWAASLPAMIVVAAVAGAVAGLRLWRVPLWLLAGHGLAMVLVHPAGTGLSLLPFTLALIGLFLYPLLWLAAFAGGWLGRVTAAR